MADTALLLSDLTVRACPLGAFELDAEEGAIRFRLAHGLGLARPRPEHLGRLVGGLVGRAWEIVGAHIAEVVTGIAALSITDSSSDV